MSGHAPGTTTTATTTTTMMMMMMINCAIRYAELVYTLGDDKNFELVEQARCYFALSVQMQLKGNLRALCVRAYRPLPDNVVLRGTAPPSMLLLARRQPPKFP